ncbi:MAG: hypothetical protein AABX62_02750 [Thermoproteota archaeon]|jgi:hypothetical protein
MPGSENSEREGQSSRHDEFEDIEILKNLLELRTRLKKERGGIDTELE